jgi:WD40 repeat protein
VQSLRGLDGQIAHSKVCFASNASRVAALSLDWRIAIWDLPSGFLHSLIDVAPGPSADNSGLAFSHDGRKFAYAAGTEAKLWDLESGRATSWRLPQGLGDTLVFDATDTRLWLFRVETADGMHPPDSRSPVRQYPRVCRMRDLLASREYDLRNLGNCKPVWEAGEFDAGNVQARATADGSYLVAVGSHGNEKRERFTKVFESSTGHVLLSLPSDDFDLEVTGQFLAVHLRSDVAGACELLKLPSGELVDSITGQFLAIGPGARFLAAKTPTGFGYSLRRRDERSSFATLGIDTWTEEGRPTFSRDGALLAWGNRDGTVTVCHLEEVQRRLTAIGLGW